MVFGKRFRKIMRYTSVYVPLIDINIRKMSGICKATVFYRSAAANEPYCLTCGERDMLGLVTCFDG